MAMYSAMNDLPIGTPEQAGLFSIGKANVMQNMQDPIKNRMATAMMGKALGQIGQGFFGAAPMGGSTQARAPRFDAYGNPIG